DVGVCRSARVYRPVKRPIHAVGLDPGLQRSNCPKLRAEGTRCNRTNHHSEDRRDVQGDYLWFRRTHGTRRGMGGQRQRWHGSGSPGVQAGMFVFWTWPLPVRSGGTVGGSRRKEAPLGDAEVAGLGTSKAATAWQE